MPFVFLFLIHLASVAVFVLYMVQYMRVRSRRMEEFGVFGPECVGEIRKPPVFMWLYAFSVLLLIAASFFVFFSFLFTAG